MNNGCFAKSGITLPAVYIPIRYGALSLNDGLYPQEKPFRTSTSMRRLCRVQWLCWWSSGDLKAQQGNTDKAIHGYPQFHTQAAPSMLMRDLRGRFIATIGLHMIILSTGEQRKVTATPVIALQGCRQ